MNTSFRAVVFTCLLAGLSSVFSTHAADITNPGFERDWEGWTQGDPSGSGTAISKKAHSGDKSVKLTEKSSYAAQVVAVQPNTMYRLNAFVLGTGNLGAKVGTGMYFEQTPKKTKRMGTIDGQVVICQIHAGKDEPARLYYQKFPDSQHGAFYLAHEPSGGGDIYVELLGRKTSVLEDPEDGIALDEKFSYEIKAEGHNLTVTISQGGKVRVQKNHRHVSQWPRRGQ